MLEPNEVADGVEDLEIFRLSSRGGLELHHSESNPIVTLKTNGLWGYDPGVPFDSRGLDRLGRYLVRYARRLSKLHPSHAL